MRALLGRRGLLPPFFGGHGRALIGNNNAPPSEIVVCLRMASRAPDLRSSGTVPSSSLRQRIQRPRPLPVLLVAALARLLFYFPPKFIITVSRDQ